MVDISGVSSAPSSTTWVDTEVDDKVENKATPPLLDKPTLTVEHTDGSSAAFDKVNSILSALAPAGVEMPLVKDVETMMIALMALVEFFTKERADFARAEMDMNEKEIQAKSDEAIKKIEEFQILKEKQEKSDLATKILGGLAVGFGAVLTALTGGAAAIVMTLVSVALFAVEASGKMDELLTKIVETLPEDQRSGAKGGIGAAIMVLVMILSIVASRGSSAGGVAAKLSTKLASEAGRATMQNVVSGVQAASGAMTATGQVVASVYNYETTNAQADLEKQQATQMLLQVLQEMIESFLELFTESYNDAVEVTSDSLASNYASKMEQYKSQWI